MYTCPHCDICHDMKMSEYGIEEPHLAHSDHCHTCLDELVPADLSRNCDCDFCGVTNELVRSEA